MCTLNNLASMVHALLTATLAKLWGSKKADACAACMDSTILSHSDWANHKHCNLEPDLDATSLSLLCSGVKVSLPAALARSWVTRLLANYDGGLADAGARSWRLQPRRSCWKPDFSKVTLDAACPKMRLQQWSAYCRCNKLVMQGKSLRRLAEQAFGRLLHEGAWETCAREGVTDKSLKEILQVHNLFFRKLILDDVWLSHGAGLFSLGFCIW